MDSFLNALARYLWQQSWQIAAVVAVVALTCRLLRGRSAHWRYLLWLVVLAKCLAPPLVSVALPVLPVASRPPAAREVPLAAAAPAPAAAPAEAGASADATSPVDAASPVTVPPVALHRKAISRVPDEARRSPRSYLPEWTPAQWAAVGWLAGTAGFLLLALGKALRIHRRLRRARRPAGGEIEGLVAELAARLGLRRAPRVWLVDAGPQPFVWGVLRGSVHLPAELAGRCGRNAPGVLMHELAHVARRDAIVNVVQVVAQAVFFFHPLIWWANRRIRCEREKCCDETAVAALGSRPEQYSSALVEALVRKHGQGRAFSSLAIAGPVKNLEERIRTIMTKNRTFHRRPTRWAVAAIVLFAALAVPTGLVLTARAVPAAVTSGEPPEPRAREAPEVEMVPCVRKYSVMLVVDDEEADRPRMSFEGRKVTWRDLPGLLKDVPRRDRTVLAVGVTADWLSGKSTAARAEERQKLMSRVARLSRGLGFEGLSFTGQKPLGAKGAARYDPTITPADRRGSVEATPAARRLLGLWSGSAIDKPGEGTSRDSLVLELKLDAKGRVVCTTHGSFVRQGCEKARALRIDKDRIEFHVRHRSGLGYSLRSSLRAPPTDGLMRIALRLEGEALVGEARPVVEGDSCDIRLKRITPWPPRPARVSPAAAKALVGQWTGTGVDQPPGSSRDPIVLELRVTGDGGLAGTASGEFALSRLGQIWNLRVDGPQVRFEVLHRTGARMGVKLDRKDGRLVGVARPLDIKEDACDLTLRRADPTRFASTPPAPAQARRFVGVWRGVAPDKAGRGISLDLLAVTLKMGDDGRLEGVATGRFVRGGEAKLQDVRAGGNRLEFVVLHRTNVRVKAALRLEGGALRGEGAPVGTTEDPCDIVLVKEPIPQRGPAGLWYGLATDKPGQGSSVDAFVLDLRKGKGGRLAGALYGHFSRSSPQEVRNLRADGDRLEFEAIHRTGIKMKVTLTLKDGKLVGEAVPADVDDDACDITLQRPVKGAKEPGVRQGFWAGPRTGFGGGSHRR